MVKSEVEIFWLYLAENPWTDELTYEQKETLKETFGYQLFVLNYRLNELKKEIIESKYGKWLSRLMRW